MTMHDFLRKYGTRAIPMLIRELAAYQKADYKVAVECADDLQAMLETFMTHNDLLDMSIRQVCNWEQS